MSKHAQSEALYKLTCDEQMHGLRSDKLWDCGPWGNEGTLFNTEINIDCARLIANQRQRKVELNTERLEAERHFRDPLWSRDWPGRIEIDSGAVCAYMKHLGDLKCRIGTTPPICNLSQRKSLSRCVYLVRPGT